MLDGGLYIKKGFVSPVFQSVARITLCLRASECARVNLPVFVF